MEIKELVSAIKDQLTLAGKLYLYDNLPAQISNAVYTFGDTNSFDILAYIDASIKQDGSRGMLIYPDGIYFKFGQQGFFKYDEIVYLGIEKHRNDPSVKGIIKTEPKTYSFSNITIDPEVLVTFLSKVTELDIDMIMSNHEKVAYYVPIVLSDLENDEYEDIQLSPADQSQIQEFYQNLAMIKQLDDENYQYELEQLCHQALSFFDELGLDSDEIDQLLMVQKEFDQEDLQEEQKIDNAKKYYDDMMDKYRHGDTSMYDNVKAIMNQMGIDENELAGKSPEEIEDILCEKFGISKSMMEKLKNRFMS